MAELHERLKATLGTGFQVERELGGGGMSRVFLVIDEALGRRIIIKVLPPELAEGVSLERFAREIRTVAQLQHPHIVPVLSAGRVDDLPYYAMPYVSGDSARALLHRGSPLSVRQVVDILRDVAKALDFAHRHGVVHRDIKPDNILLSENAAVVSDFGIAKAVSAARSPEHPATLTSVGTSIGTPAYMAPEQALGESDIDHRADIYSFGVTAYELLTGHVPFADRPAQSMIRAHISEAPAPIVSKRDDIPAPLARLVMRCLEKDPARRPASASELLQGLEEASGAHPRAGNRPRRIAATLGVTVLLAVLAFVLWTRESAASSALPAVAVLPFENLSRDTTSEYFSDGLTEQLIGDLGRANGLRVASRASTSAFKGKHVDPLQTASALHVDAIVTGSVRRSGDQLRLEVELVDGRTGERRWSQRYDRKLDDVFVVQEEIARSITSALKVSLAPAASDARATDGQTYDFFLRGQHAIQRGVRGSEGRVNLDSAIANYRRALDRDSTFAPAWSGLSEAYRQMAEHTTPLAVLPRAKEAARRAVQLDPSDLSAGLALANITLNFDWDWEAAEREYRRVLTLHPDAPSLHVAYGSFLQALRRHDEALERIERASDLEWRQAIDTVGLRVVHLRRVAFIKARMGRHAQADQHMQEAIRIAPQSAITHAQYGLILLTRDPSVAVKELETARATMGDQLPLLSWLGVAYGNAGRPDSTRRIIAELVRRSRTEYVPKDQLFVLHLAINDRPGAFKWLRQAIEEHHWWLPYLNSHPMAEHMRHDQEYQALMRRIGVPQSAL